MIKQKSKKQKNIKSKKRKIISKKHKKNKTKQKKQFFTGGLTSQRRKKSILLEEPLLDEAKLRREKLAKQREEKFQKQLQMREFERLHARLPQERKSYRISGFDPIPTRNVIKDIINASKGYEGYSQVLPEQMEEFVREEIKPGPQKVTLVVGDQSHAILVDVQPDKIMISDWKGSKFVSDPINPRYKNYNELVQYLSSINNKPIEFYPVDPFLLSESEKKSKRLGNLGGCSEYNELWSKIYYKKGYYEYPI